MSIIKNWWGRITCKRKGHLRGKRVSADQGRVTFRCPRCGVTWERKVGAKTKAPVTA